jgi:hypothetical protein
LARKARKAAGREPERERLKAEIAVIADIHGKIVTDYDTIGRYLRPIIVCPHFSPLTRNDPPGLHGQRRKDLKSEGSTTTDLRSGSARWE